MIATTNRIGFVMDTVIATIIDLKHPCVTIMEIVLKIVSNIDWSLENLEVTLPIGLESKNNILDRRTFQAILLCILVVAIKTKISRTIDLIRTRMI